MYFGSVRFFKHIILCVVCLAIVVPMVTTLFLVAENRDLSAKLNGVAMGDSEINLALMTLTGTGVGLEKFPQYSSLYPGLRVEGKEIERQEDKVAYLTFDDGPSEVTDSILKTLKKYGVKATFFVVGYQLNSEKNQKRLQRIAAEGHAIGIHTYSHDYNKIYSSIDAYLKDFNKVWTKVKGITGVEAEVFRFPGGSLNGYNQNLQQQLVAEMLWRGFRYYDWNVSSMDASVDNSYSVDAIIGYSVDVPKKDNPIILMHDSGYKLNTARALPTVIEKLMEKGFSFKALDGSVQPVVFGYGQ